MKSIILSFFLLSTTLSLVPFVAFSRPFTSDNPIVLPTTTNYNNAVLDTDGVPLMNNENYKIISMLLGGGSVYLADLGNSKCPNGVVQGGWRDSFLATPVKFFNKQLGSHVVHENQDINIMFSTVTSKLCVNETVWKAGDYILAPNPPPIFVVTGGRLGIPGPNTFKIENYETQGKFHAYKLRYCPSNLNCVYIGLTHDNGYARLALNNKPTLFGFEKIKKNEA